MLVGREKQDAALASQGPSLEARLISATRQSRVTWVRARLKDGADVNHCDQKGSGPFCCTPLTLAIGRRRADIVQLLLEHGADPNLVAHIDSPLISAAKGGSIAICKLLLERGADPDFLSGHGERAIDQCSRGTTKDRQIHALLASASARKRIRGVTSLGYSAIA
jgi:hypothetical protein